MRSTLTCVACAPSVVKIVILVLLLSATDVPASKTAALFCSGYLDGAVQGAAGKSLIPTPGNNRDWQQHFRLPGSLVCLRLPGSLPDGQARELRSGGRESLRGGSDDSSVVVQSSTARAQTAGAPNILTHLASTHEVETCLGGGGDEEGANSSWLKRERGEDPHKVEEGLKGLTLPRNLLRKYGKGDLDADSASVTLVTNADKLDASLVLAAAAGDVERVAALVREGACVNSLYVPLPQAGVEPSGCTPLHAAAENGSTAVADALLQQGAHPNARDRDGGTPLHRAAYWGRYEVMGTLIGHGADPEARDKDGMSALHNAAIQGMAEVVGGLVAAGADVDGGDEAFDTPLHLASLYGHASTVKKLLACNASVNALNKDNITALQNAVAFGHSGAAALLLEAGADANIADVEGNTALHTAVMLGRVDMVAYLLAHDGDCMRKNAAGVSAYKTARKHNINPQVTKLLRKYLAVSAVTSRQAQTAANAMSNAAAPDKEGAAGAMTWATTTIEAGNQGHHEGEGAPEVVDEVVQTRLRGGSAARCGRVSLSLSLSLSSDATSLRLRGGGSRSSWEHASSSNKGAPQSTTNCKERTGAGGCGGRDARGCGKGRRGSWMCNWEALLRYRQEHGHSKVSQSQGALGKWSAMQRHHAAAGTLRTNRVAKLRAIGFNFDPQGEVWYNNWHKLLLYRQQHGDCNPLQTARGDQGVLGRWVGQQRHLHHCGTLRGDRSARLLAAGLIFNKGDLEWDRHLSAFQKERERRLRLQVRTDQRRLMDGMQDEQQMLHLAPSPHSNDVGRSRKGVPGARLDGMLRPSSLNSSMGDTDCGGMWGECTGDAEDAAVASAGLQNPSEDSISALRLMSWLSYQRELRRRGRLRADRMARLDDAGMVWNLQDAQWTSNLARVRRCLESSSLPAPAGGSQAAVEARISQVHKEEGLVRWAGEGAGEGLGFWAADSETEADANTLRRKSQKLPGRWIGDAALLQWLQTQQGQVRRNSLRADRLVELERLPVPVMGGGGRGRWRGHSQGGSEDRDTRGHAEGEGVATGQGHGGCAAPSRTRACLDLLPAPIVWRNGVLT